MKQEISNPHDKLFKQLLGEPENAASFLANNLPGEIVSHLDLNTLQVEQVSFIDSQFIQSEADLLFSITIAGRAGFVYILFEHQSSPDVFMMLRLLSYMVRVWERFQQENKDCDRLPVIVPMVLFHGPKGWRGPLAFQSLVDMPAESFAPYTPQFQGRLYDLSPFGRDQLAGNAVIRILEDLLGAVGRRDFEERVKRALETLNELMNAPSFARYLEIIFRYVLQVFDIQAEKLGDMVTQTLKPDVKEFIMTTYEQLIQKGKKEGEQIGLQKGKKEGEQIGLQKGKKEGEQIGLQKGANLVLIRQLARRFHGDTTHLIPLLNELNPEQLAELGERILEAKSLEEIEQWLKSVCRT
ncbi:MAG: Rpn family recombination-promoting nuclease/putative transposase [Candidatus Tectomicrobia bacterium]|uniref:Rpn family recombination-promoting nuclease/putative transposase n=1 Tax=Tectimicrobiota bacterium TaxID=2528274 RepID=A0A933GJT1_UNCTE|nr:Rpn family recombination-promoting nuclease/putative transposase [Candidatus Tectomicrobia bacterium]